jgi:hypothetical protein
VWSYNSALHYAFKALFLIKNKDDFAGFVLNALNNTTRSQWAVSMLVTSDGISGTYYNTD